MSRRGLSFGTPVTLQGGFDRWVENALRQVERWSHTLDETFDSRDSVTEITVNGSTLPDHGLALIRTTGGTGHILPPPRLGVTLTITCFNASTNDISIVGSTSLSIDGSSANKLLFEVPDTVVLKGASDTEWIIAQSNGSVTLQSTS